MCIYIYIDLYKFKMIISNINLELKKMLRDIDFVDSFRFKLIFIFYFIYDLVSFSLFVIFFYFIGLK